jgi:hypothetical protein
LPIAQPLPSSMLDASMSSWLWRASFEAGVGIIDPHPLSDHRQYFLAEVLPINQVRFALLAHELVGFVAASPRPSPSCMFALGFSVGASARSCLPRRRRNRAEASGCIGMSGRMSVLCLRPRICVALVKLSWRARTLRIHVHYWVAPSIFFKANGVLSTQAPNRIPRRRGLNCCCHASVAAGSRLQ